MKPSLIDYPVRKEFPFDLDGDGDDWEHGYVAVKLCDGVFSSTSQNGAETFRFRNLEAITDKEVEKLLLEISSKVLKLLKKHGYLNHEGEMANHPLSDSLFRDRESLALRQIHTSSNNFGEFSHGPNK